MATVPAAEERAPELDEKTLAQATRTVAAYAADAGDLVQLLDMLGLGSPVRCAECGGSMSLPTPLGYRHSRGGGGLCAKCRPRLDRGAGQPRCACGQLARDGSDACGKCVGLVPIDDARMVVERIKWATGKSVYTIAKEAGLHPTSLSSAFAPSAGHKRIARKTYAALKRLAEELGA